MRLYEIDNEIEDFESRLADGDGELSADMEVEWQTLIEERDDKWRCYIAVIRQMEAESKAFKDEADRLAAKATTRNNAASWLKSRLLDSMDLAGVTEAKTPIGKVKAMFASVRPVVLKVAVEDLPAELQRVRIEADLKAIGVELKAGNGAVEELAELGAASRYVRIF